MKTDRSAFLLASRAILGVGISPAPNNTFRQEEKHDWSTVPLAEGAPVIHADWLDSTMRLKKLFMLMVIGSILAIWLTRPTGWAAFEVQDVTMPSEGMATAPWWPSRTGAFHVVVKGELDGDGRLHIYSNHGRDHATLRLRAGQIHESVGEAEAWVDDLRVVYEPINAKNGRLRVELSCGRSRE